MRQPVGQRGAAFTFVPGILQRETRGQMRQRGEGARFNDGARLVEITAMQNVDDLWFRQRFRLPRRVATEDVHRRGCRINDGLRWQLGQRLVRNESERVCGDGDALGLASFGGVRGDGSFDFGGKRGCVRRIIRRDREAERADEMPTAMRLLEHDGEVGTGLERQRFREFKDRLMRLADGWMNPPRRLDVAIERAFDAPARLVEIRRGATELHRLRLGGSSLEDAQFDLGQM